MIVQLVVEKWRHTPLDTVFRIIEEVERQAWRGDNIGMIVFGSNPAPILDPGPSRLSPTDSFTRAPQMPGRPNPGPALVEAVDQMASSTVEVEEWPLILVWSARSRPKHLDLHLSYAIDAGASIRLIALRPSKPPWLDEEDYQGKLVIKRIRKNTNIKRLVSEVLNTPL